MSTNADRRENPRLPLVVNAAIYYNSLTLPYCRTRDLSAAGAFIDIGDHVLPQNANVEVLLGDSGRLPARIVRYTEGGVGVSFAYMDYGQFEAVANLLRQQSG